MNAETRTHTRLRDSLLIAIYAAINALFVAKYATRAGAPEYLAVGGYLALLAVAIAVLPRAAGWKRVATRHPGVYWALVIIAAILFTAIMKRFDPEAIRVSRYTALRDWLTRFLHGQFPYDSPVNPSSFPVAFLCALPFYWLGDLGYLQIAAWLLFAWVCRDDGGRDPSPAIGALGLLAASPIFLYEVVTRSELFSNMMLVIIVLVAIERRTPRASGPWLAIAAGLVLSTRGIVALIDALAFTAFFRRDLKAGVRFAVIAATAFLVSVAPFALWDPQAFMRNGPFAIQMSYAPKPVLAAAFLVAVVLGFRAKQSRDVYEFIALLIFTLIGGLLVATVIGKGWHETLLHDHFDISYFAFSHTFAIYTLARFGGRRNGSQGLRAA